MARTQITGDQVQDSTLTGDDILDGAVGREDLNITSTGRAVVRKILAGAGVSLVSSGIDDGTGDVTINVAVTSTGGITQSQHRNLRQAVHVFADTGYYEVAYSSGQVTNETWWSNDTKVLKIRTIDYTYAGSKCTTSVLKIYNISGSVVETLTEDYNYTGSRLNSIDYTLT